MVNVTSRHSGIGSKDAIELEGWLDSLRQDYASEDREFIRRAALMVQTGLGGEALAGGAPDFHRALGIARTLADLHLDPETIAAGILHGAVDADPAAMEAVRQKFGERVAMLVDGVARMGMIHEGQDSSEGHRREHAQAESLRKMLLAMAEDVSVVLIKLAGRLHQMRTLGALPEESRQRIARETMDIFAPLANRLGIWQLKWELEDLAFRHLKPQAYRQIAGWLAERRVDRQQYIERFVDVLNAELRRAGIAAEVTGRPKHIYGIWRKMQRKGKDFNQIFDVRAVRVLVNEVRDCYAALGVVHTQWPYIPGEFDDYIATPKENSYRSIHTAVIGPEGKTVEVQVRTRDMHQQSELGVAAHWRYKEDARPDTVFDRKITWLRQLLDWKDEVAEASEFVDQFKSEVFIERVYVFTPKGKIVDLPQGSTPLDFAYHIHTDVGHRCRGAKVNGRIVPLTYALSTGERVEVLTVKEGGPSRDWLSPHLGYLRTSKARAKVQAWFRQQNYESSVSAGRAGLEREFQRLGMNDVNYEKLAHYFDFAKVDDFLAAIGRGEVRPAQIVAAVQELSPPRPAAAAAVPLTRAQPGLVPLAGVTVQGVGNLLTRMGRCCNPVPGDAIVGFITRGQGVTIHRSDCPNALRHHDEHDERLIEVGWGESGGATYPVEVEVIGYERPGLLRDITALLANQHINVIAVSTMSDKQQHVTHINLTLEIPNIGTLSQILAQIDQLPNVTEVRRRTH
ncbi:MAG: GTP diphosphokinase [Gammaproteobacteria bacterium]|nr:GTP diphosphokinase [Gammaproteobacteria bacterium]